MENHQNTSSQELNNAIECLSRHLAEDPGYYYGWRENIAACVCSVYKELHPDAPQLPVLHAASEGAGKFLDMLISKTRK